jgi:hypothetical protein
MSRSFLYAVRTCRCLDCCVILDQLARNEPCTRPKVGKDAQSRGSGDDLVGDISLFCCMSSAKATSVIFRAGKGKLS